MPIGAARETLNRMECIRRRALSARPYPFCSWQVAGLAAGAWKKHCADAPDRLTENWPSFFFALLGEPHRPDDCGGVTREGPGNEAEELTKLIGELR